VQSKLCLIVQYEHPVVLYKQHRLDTHVTYGARLHRPYDCVVTVYI